MGLSVIQMPYEIEIASGALKQLKKLPVEMRRRISKAIDDLAESPRPPGAIKLEHFPI